MIRILIQIVLTVWQYFLIQEHAVSFFFLVFSPFYLFIYFIGCAESSLLWVFSLVVVSEGLLFIAMSGLLIAVASLVGEHGLLA